LLVLLFLSTREKTNFGATLGASSVLVYLRTTVVHHGRLYFIGRIVIAANTLAIASTLPI
jgi:hypothetical protein